ncbi:hypothetical protein [Micromonospora sp. LH3U1]|uniref:hypothetical protein n=1 Tax=Micromonospora sp. LH3U1 TaxID=3018339 RepID=UPI0023499A96|nr:hypothetical protein [Micromonospora sp. LH3U1]WCN81586.1 hypothetical protein PCA76_00285 [Micromonospora sp. LH3U1]
MARQGWGMSIATAIGVAAGAGAAQLGFGYGLGVITWTPSDAGATDTAWADGLAWATWLAASSTVLGAVCAQRLHHRNAPTTAEPQVTGSKATDASDATTTPEEATLGTERPPAAEAVAPEATGGQVSETPPNDRDGLLRRVTVALGAGLGGLVTVLLIAVPARVATGADTGAPQRTAAVQAVLGILIGVLVAIWALRSRAAAVNVTVTAAWLWLLAVVSVIDGVRVGRGLTGAQLGTWQLDPDHSRYWIGDQLYWPGALLALVPALLIGVLAARRAARSIGHRVGAAASGAAGPMLVALAYLTTLPHWSTLGPAQLSTQLIAPYAVIAGVGGSVLAAVLAERADRSRAVERSRAGHRRRADEQSAADPDTKADPTPATVSGSIPNALANPPSGAKADSVPSTARIPARRSRSDARPQAPRTGSLPGEATAAPRVPAPRTGPDLSGPAHPADAETAEAPTPTSRSARPTRRSNRPTTD